MDNDEYIGSPDSILNHINGNDDVSSRGNGSTRSRRAEVRRIRRRTRNIRYSSQKRRPQDRYGEK